MMDLATATLHHVPDSMRLRRQTPAGAVDDDLTGASGPTKYVASFYYVTTFLSTVGFGDVSPSSTPERVVSTVMMFVGEQLADLCFALWLCDYLLRR
jgi:Ion channel